jgi:hypothetical protein
MNAIVLFHIIIFFRISAHWMTTSRKHFVKIPYILPL